jgi:Asp-tRNA(Asn)/Glu-tRNA(Gln) amidotransferase A subunit family amidase
MNRREFGLAMSAVSLAGLPTGETRGSTLKRGTASTMIDLSAHQAVAAMRAGAFTAEAYAEALLARCEAGRGLNAFITLEPDRVREAARTADLRRSAGDPLGALHGLPIPIKDSVNTKDLPTTAGTGALRGFRPTADATAVTRLRAAGASVLGKTNLHELSFGWTSNNLAFGAVRNPYDPARIPGGSSGGTAAAVAARMAPLGVAEDTEGSIRVPAALCGICGFRPTTGRYPTDGTAPITPLFDQIGPHARAVADLALFDAVMTGDERSIAPPSLRGLRLGLARDYYFTGLDPEVERVMEDVLARLRAAGVVLVEVETPGLAEQVSLITGPVQIHDAAAALTAYLRASGAPVSFEALVAGTSPDVKAVFEQFVLPGAPHAVSEADYMAARDVHRPAMRRLFADAFARHGVAGLLFPATMTAATPIGQAETVTIGGARVPFATAIARNIAPGGTAGLPGLVLPAGLTRDTRLPVALELDGPAGTDRDLLAVGMAIETVLGALPAPGFSDRLSR